MKAKEIVEKYLSIFESGINTPENKSKVTLFSGMRNADYFYCSMIAYLADNQYHVRLAWFVEIWIDDLCVWRKIARGNKKGESLKKHEDRLFEELLKDIIMHGLYCSWENIKKARGEKS